MAASPQFLITNKGLAAASVATNVGPFIRVTNFKVGSAYGYTPTRNDPGLNGDLLYESAPTSFQNVGDNTMDIICQIPPDAGPFDFGEVAIYIADPANPGAEVMFAKAVWDVPQTKFSSLGTNVASSYTFHCLLKLAQSIAIIKVDTLTVPAVIDLDLWSDVVAPKNSANPDVQLSLIRELDLGGNSTLLHQAIGVTANRWTVGTNYEPCHAVNAAGQTLVATVTGSSTTSIKIAAQYIPTDMNPYHNRQLVIELFGLLNPFRSVASITYAIEGGINVATLNLNPAPYADIPPNGTPVNMYENILFKNVTIPIASRSVAGIVIPGAGIDLSASGIIGVQGLIHSGPTSFSISAGDLNDITRISGVYTLYGPNSQVANCPPGVTATVRLQQMNIEGFITQLVYPYDADNGSQENTSMWWRSYPDGGGWTTWRYMQGVIPGSVTPGTPTFTDRGTINNGADFTIDTTRTTTLSGWVNKGGAQLNMFINGQHVGRTDGEGGGMSCYTAPPGINMVIRHEGASIACPIYTLEWDA